MLARKIPDQSELEKIVRDYGFYRAGARVKHEWSQPKIEWETFVGGDRYRYLSSLPTRCSILVKQNCKQCGALRYSRAYYTSYPSSPSWHWELNRGSASIVYPPDYENSLCGRKSRTLGKHREPLQLRARKQQKRTRYEKLLQLIEKKPTITLEICRKNHPEISSGTFHSTMNTLSKYNLVKKIPLDKRRMSYQKTNEYTIEKGREILKTRFWETTEKSHKKAIMPKPLQAKKEFTASRSIIKREQEISENTPAQRRRNYSWCDAAYQILKAENRPLGPTELTNNIMSAGIVKSKSRSPVNTLYSCIFQDIESKGARSRFMKFDQKIGLVEWADRYLGDYVQRKLQVATQTRYWERYKFKEISNKELLSSIRTEIHEIRAFIKGEPTVEPSQEKLCFWVWFCYQFGLYWEGALVFRRINTLKVSPPLYQIIKKMGIICESRRD